MRLEAVNDLPIWVTIIRRQEREVTMNRWQEAWTVSTKGDVDEEAVTGHQEMVRKAEPVPGLLLSSAGIDELRLCQYLITRMRSLTSSCVYCLASSDTEEHTVFNCAHWKEKRSEQHRTLRIERQKTLKIFCIDFR